MQMTQLVSHHPASADLAPHHSSSTAVSRNGGSVRSTPCRTSRTSTNESS